MFSSFRGWRCSDRLRRIGRRHLGGALDQPASRRQGWSMPLRQRYLFVCTNLRPEGNPKGSCAAKGSENVHQALKMELFSRGLAKTEARVCTSSCLDQCSSGVSVLVEPE